MANQDKWKSLFVILRLTRDMTPKQVHKLVKGKISLGTIYNWKSGRVNHPKHETMQTVLNSLGYTFVIAPKNSERFVEKKDVKNKYKGDDNAFV
jgi:hypothetical protein